MFITHPKLITMIIKCMFLLLITYIGMTLTVVLTRWEEKKDANCSYLLPTTKLGLLFHIEQLQGTMPIHSQAYYRTAWWQSVY